MARVVHVNLTVKALLKLHSSFHKQMRLFYHPHSIDMHLYAGLGNGLINNYLHKIKIISSNTFNSVVKELTLKK